MRLLNRERLAQNIERRMASDLAQNNVCGVSLLVKQAGKEIYRNHFGTVSPDSNVPLSEGAIFRLASMTKPITAVAVLILVDRGLLSLDDPVGQFFPALASPYMMTEDGERVPVKEVITVRHLLTHSSGIGSGDVWSRSPRPVTEEDKRSVESFASAIAEQPISFVPGTKAEYSPVAAFSLLTGIIQQVTGRDYEEFLRNEILDPCGMKDTTFTPNREQWARLITLHNKVDGVSVAVKTAENCIFEGIPTTNYLGGAGLVSTLEDYSHFTAMLMGRGVFEGKRILSEESFQDLCTPRIAERKRGSMRYWGLGVRVITSEEYGVLPVGTFGWSGAYGTHFWIDPVNQIEAIYMKNSRFDGGSGAVTSANFEKDVFAALR
ncbi:MAG: beta-lactamase family protein [Clostridia bacterium]|nr:beta-lactamase family protein [Clostridia bacterium]